MFHCFQQRQSAQDIRFTRIVFSKQNCPLPNLTLNIQAIDVQILDTSIILDGEAGYFHNEKKILPFLLPYEQMKYMLHKKIKTSYTRTSECNYTHIHTHEYSHCKYTKTVRFNKSLYNFSDENHIFSPKQKHADARGVGVVGKKRAESDRPTPLGGGGVREGRGGSASGGGRCRHCRQDGGRRQHDRQGGSPRSRRGDCRDG